MREALACVGETSPYVFAGQPAPDEHDAAAVVAAEPGAAVSDRVQVQLDAIALGRGPVYRLDTKSSIRSSATLIFSRSVA